MKKIIALFALYSPLLTNAQSIHFSGDTTCNAPYVRYLHDNYVLVGLEFAGATLVYDCTDPNNIINLSGVSIPGGTEFIQIHDTLVYSGSWMTNSVSIADFSNIFAPLVIGNLNGLNGLPGGIAVNGDYFYLALANDSLYVVDQSDLSSPFIINQVNIDGSYTRELVIDDTIVYAATANGIRVIDVSDPVNPTLVTAIGSNYFEISIDTLNSRLFASKGNSNGFDVFDISVPADIDLLFSGGNGYTGKGVAYYDNKIMQGTENGINNVVAVYDVSSAPVVLIDTHPINAGCTGITAKDSIFYSGDYENFSIFNLSEISGLGITTFDNTANTIRLYPNPFIHEITINSNALPQNQNCELIIRNAPGTIVCTKKITQPEETISLEKLSAGTYIWQVVIDNVPYDTGLLVKTDQ